MIFAGQAMASQANLLKNGDFSQKSDSHKIPHWHGKTQNGLIELQDGPGGNTYVSIRTDQAVVDANRGISLHQTVPVNSSWKELTVSAKIRVLSVTPGAKSHEDTRIFVRFLDAERKHVGGYPCVFAFEEATNGWISVSKTIEVPQEARFIQLNAEIWNALGDMYVDDISVVVADETK